MTTTTGPSTIVTDAVLDERTRTDTDWFDRVLPITEVVEAVPAVTAVQDAVTVVDVGVGEAMGEATRVENRALVASARPGLRAPRTTARPIRRRSSQATGWARWSWDELEAHPARLAFVLFVALTTMVVVITARWTVPIVYRTVAPAPTATAQPTPSPRTAVPAVHIPHPLVGLDHVRSAPQAHRTGPTTSTSITPSPSVAAPGGGVSTPPVEVPSGPPSSGPVVPPGGSSSPGPTGEPTKTSAPPGQPKPTSSP